MANQNQNPVGNNGSLEDCHTNLYALTDIAGIQYKKFVSNREGYVNSLDDPVLVLYTKCLQLGILSSWNKAKKDEKSNLSDMSGYVRELWIFWYDGNDPLAMKNISIPNAIKEDDHGNWKNGLTYEIRSILFKALNTNFERYFLSKGFVRMGPWIQMPYRSNKHSESQYGFNVKFFLHGESTICGAIDVRNVATVRQITMKDLLECNCNYKKEVLLSPYAVRAYITGRGLKDDDANVKQQYEEWLKYYPLVFPQSNVKVAADALNNAKKSVPHAEQANNPPMFIEIITGSCKMKYPSCLVCVQMEEDSDNHAKPKENRKRRFNQIEVPDGHLFSYAARRFSDRILKEIMIPLSKTKREANEKTSTKSKCTNKQWRYCNPFWKSPCSCKRSAECDHSTRIRNENVKTDEKGQTFHRKLKNLEIPFTKILFPKDSLQIDLNSNKQIPVSRLDVSCDRCTSPTNIVPNDPIMPTLSPQYPSTSESSFSQQFQSNTHQTSSSISKQSSANLCLQTDMNPFSEFNDKIANKTYNAVSTNINLGNSSSTITSRSPPPPSITPSSIVLNNCHSVKTDTCAGTSLNDATKSEPSDKTFDKKMMDSLPSGIEINQRPVPWTRHVTTTISVINKPLLYRKHVHCQPGEDISDINLFPPIANSLQKSEYNAVIDKDGTVNYGMRTDGMAQESLINNNWLTVQSRDSPPVDCSPLVKRMKSLVNYHRGSYSNYQSHSATLGPQSGDSTNKLNHGSSTKNHKTHTSVSIEKNEKTSLIPDQIFDDSDEDDGALQRMEPFSSKSSLANQYNDKILSPNNSQTVMLRSNPYAKFTGSSILSSGGAGCVTAVELSLMYPTPPSLEGVIAAIGSPAERQTGQQLVTVSSNCRNVEYNHNESLLTSLSMYCQNWDEMDKDWCVPPVNSSLFSSGLKYSKVAEVAREPRLLSFNHARLQFQRGKLKRLSMDTEQKVSERFMPAVPMNSMYHHARRPSTFAPSHLYGQGTFPNPQSRVPNGAPRFPGTSGQNSAPMTPASACTNPPSVDSSIGTPRKMDYLTTACPAFSRPQVVHSSPVTARSPRMAVQTQMCTPGPLSSCSVTQSVGGGGGSHTTVNSLYFNVLLSDSILNVYKDHNFDSCNICVCSMSVMGSDIGLYIDDYQQNMQHSFVNRSLSADDLMNGSCSSKDCKCGFSAIMNRHYAINSNLFYEDEVEITGLAKPHVYRSQHNGKDRQDVITKQYGSQILSVYDEFGLSFLLDYIRFKNTVNKQPYPENVIEFQDFNMAIYHALEQACDFSERVYVDKDKLWLSRLYYFKKDVPIPKNYNDQIRLLMTLRPLLQEAVSNTRLLQSSYTVDGPLTWKTFHRLAGRGNLESCEPQPLPRFQVFSGKHSSKEATGAASAIPGLVASTDSGGQSSSSIHSQFTGTNNGYISTAQGTYSHQSTGKHNSLSYFSVEGNPLCLTNGYPEKEKECLTISPYAVREWDKLNLEPIFRPKEVAYAIVTPTDSGKVLQKSLITYFKELNNAFHACRLGNHFSFRSERLKDDIHSSFIEINTEYWNDKEHDKSMTLQPASLQKYWIKELSKVMPVTSAEEFISKLVWYVKQCEVQTTSTLGQYGVHKRNGTKSSLFPTGDSQKKEHLNVNQTLELLLSPSNGCGSLSKVLNTKVWSSDKDVYLVIYLINPFTHGQDISEATYRLSNQWMNQLCHKISKNLHSSWKSRITFQLLSINKIFDATQFGTNVGVGDNDGSSIGGRDSSATSSISCTSSSVSWSVKWCRQWNWKSTAFAVYNSVRRKICRISGLQSILNSRNNSVNLCSSAKCSMARGCASDDECESAASLINANRCQTKCGPSGFNEKLTVEYLKKFFLESQDKLNKSQNSISIYAPPYILAPSKGLTYQTMGVSTPMSSGHGCANTSESWGYIGDKSNVLFVAYCLSVDQKWLLATCTDLLGTVQRQVQINIVVPQLHLRKKASPRRIGLGKLWDFVQEVLSDTCQPWRLVMGRLGRSGHGELKSWNGLLSRQNLARVNQRFREECAMCRVWGGSPASHGTSGVMGSVGRADMCALQIPTIVSGCFVSLESHSSLRIFPGSVKPEERASSSLPLCTPRDVSVTHILVFPTSTSAGALQNDQDPSGVGGGVNDMNLEELLKFGNEGLEELGNISNIDMSDNLGGFSTEFDSYGRLQGLHPMMPRTNSSSGQHEQMDNASMGGLDMACFPVCTFASQEEGHMLMQQPLAMGYYLSTTDPGPLPSWFWSAGPPPSAADSSLPSCFKAALHLQTSLISQEDGGSGLSGSSGAAPHPLDSHQTCDVLRFVLESYHALSWLTFDPSINDRRSCLPIHFLFLAQLYEADQSFM